MVGWIGHALVRRPWLALALAMASLIALFLAGQADLPWSDPLRYATLAHGIATDAGAVFASPGNHPFVMRIGITAPLALLYRVLGVSSFVTNLPSLAGGLGVLAAGYAATSTPRARLFAVLFGITCVPLVRSSMQLEVDLPCAALMAWSIVLLARRDVARGALATCGAAAVLFAAFLVKETAVWCVPIWLYAIGCDLRSGGLRLVARRYGAALLLGGALTAGYLAVCAHVWGDPWARLRGVEELTQQHTWRLQGRPAGAWIRRLTWEPITLFARQLGLLLVPAAFAPWLVRGRDRIWWIAAATIVLLYWFGSASLSSYSPLPIRPRMLLPALPGLIVIAALAGDAALARIASARWRVACVAILAVGLLVPSVRAAAGMVARARPETAAFRALRRDVTAAAGPTVLVCCDERCPEVASFYFGFAPPAGLTIETAPDFERAGAPAGATVRVLFNRFRAAELRRMYGRGAWSPPVEAAALRPIAGDHAVRLYAADDATRLWQAWHAAR